MNGDSVWSRRRHPRRRFLGGAGLGAVGLALAGCGGAPAAPTAIAAAPTSAPVTGNVAPSPTAVATPQAKYGGTLTPEASTGRPAGMDHHTNVSYAFHGYGAGVAMSRVVRLRVEPGTP